MKELKILSIKKIGIRDVYNVTMKGKQHNYCIKDNKTGTEIFTANSHAKAYAVLAMQCAYLKAHYPLQYMKSFLNVEMLDKKIENVDRYIKECLNMKIQILPCNINKSKATFTTDSEKNAIRRGLASFKGIGMKASVEIEKLSPFKDLEEFVDKTIDISDVNKSVIEVLMQNGAFSCFNLHGEEGLNKYLELKKHIKYRKEKNIQKSSMFDFSQISFSK